MCVCVCPSLHVFVLSVTDGEGKVENPIKNRLMKKTGAEMRGKRADSI